MGFARGCLLLAVYAAALTFGAQAAAAQVALDPTFGGFAPNIPGTVTTDFPGSGADSAGGIVVQPDGRIVVAGHTTVTGDENFALARYNRDGSLDGTFGTGGLVSGGTLAHDRFQAVTLQADGKIVAVGFTGGAGLNRFAVARYNPDGSPDTGFGGTGVVTTDISGANDQATAVAIDALGRIVVAGWAVGPTGNDLFALARYSGVNGALDTTGFGAPNGFVTTDFDVNPTATNDHRAQAVLIQPDGMILAAGFGRVDGADDEDFALARYGPTGALDTTYGVAPAVGPFPGTVVTDLGATDHIMGLARQSDGNVVAAGWIDRTALPPTPANFGIARYDPTGHLDPSFGGDGDFAAGTTETDFAGGNDRAAAVSFLPGGNILAAGFRTLAGTTDFALAFYTSTGAPDTTSAPSGRLTTNFAGNGDENVNALALQTDGGILAAGSATASPPNFAVARYRTPIPVPPNGGPTPPGGVPAAPGGCGDTTGPAVRVSGRRIFRRGARARVAITASDPSGLCVDPSNPRKRLSTRSTGSRAITASAIDTCGNRSDRRFDYTVAGDPRIAVRGFTRCVLDTVTARVRIASPADMRRVTVSVAGERVRSTRRKRFTFTIDASGAGPGRHPVRIRALDAVGNSAVARTSFRACPARVPNFTG